MRERFSARLHCLIVSSLIAIVTVGCGRGGQALTSPSGWTRVIVTLHLQQPLETDEQRGRAIATARQALLAQLASAPHRVTRMYETVPAVALDVSPEAILVLRKSPLVAAIEEDRLDAPQ